MPFSCCNSDSYFDLRFDELSFWPIFLPVISWLALFLWYNLNSSLNIKIHLSESFLIGHVIIHSEYQDSFLIGHVIIHFLLLFFQNCLCFRFLFVGLFCICFVLILFVSFCSCLLNVQQQCLVSSPLTEYERYFNSGSLGLFLISLATDTGAQSRRKMKSCSQNVARLRMFSCASRRTLHVSACFWSTLPSGLLVKMNLFGCFVTGKAEDNPYYIFQSITVLSLGRMMIFVVVNVSRLEMIFVIAGEWRQNVIVERPQVNLSCIIKRVTRNLYYVWYIGTEPLLLFKMEAYFIRKTLLAFSFVFEKFTSKNDPLNWY